MWRVMLGISRDNTCIDLPINFNVKEVVGDVSIIKQ